MAERVGRTDLFAWGLFLAGLLLALCVLGYDPSGQPVPLLGEPGQLVAVGMFDALGTAVYVFLTGWFVVVLLLLQRPGFRPWFRRFAGWLLLVPCAALATDWAQNGGPKISGGALGAWLHTRLLDMVPPLAAGAIFGVCLFVGMILAVDPLVTFCWNTLRALVIFLWRGLRSILGLLGRIFRLFARKPAGLPGIKPVPVPFQASIPIHHAEELPPEPASEAEVPPTIAPPINRPVPMPLEDEKFEGFELPPLALLGESAPFPYEAHDQKLREMAALLEKTFADFQLNVRVVGINTGPVITQYEVALETGLRVHKITGLADDLALNLKVPSVRIVAPIPGKNTVGIEIPNEHRAVVRLKEVILGSAKKIAKMKIPLFLGKDTEGRPLVYDLAEMPHLLIAGRTGTGKSVCMNAIILSMLMTRRPDEVRMVMIDPKMLELSEYGKIPHLMHPVVKDMKKAEAILSWAVDKMEERYDLLSRARVRSIAGYNELSIEEIHRRVQPDDEEAARIPEKMPYIVIFVDEMNDLMMTMKREVEGHIIRLAQKSRAAGIHLVVATQKPTVDVITGLIKSNLPARICFQVSSRSDSRVVLDEMGADKLLGKGDMLFLQPGTSTLVRAQGTYAADEEITRVVENLECDPCYAQELIQLKSSSEASQGGSTLDRLRARDEMYEPAIEVVVREGRGSVSLLQRALGIGYGRAARLIDFMAEDGIVGAYNGSNAREVIFTPEDWEAMKQGGAPVRA